MTKPSQVQLALCRRYGAVPEPCDTAALAGVALATLQLSPLNALRHPAEKGTCGWYIWGGQELSQDDHFFSSLHASYLSEYVPSLMPYLALPPGWRVLLAPQHEDVWYDPALLNV